MSSNTEREAKAPTGPRRFSRRFFLQTVVAGGLYLGRKGPARAIGEELIDGGIDGGINAGEASSRNSADTVDKDYFNWREAHGLAAQINEKEKRPYARQTVASLQQGLWDLEAVCDPFVERLDRINQAAEDQHRKNPEGSYIGHTRRILGEMELPFSGASPFERNREDLRDELNGVLDELKKNNQILEGGQYPLPQVYERLAGNIASGVGIVKEHEGDEAERQCRGQVVVGLDPSIRPTPQGKERFAQDRRTVLSLVSGLPIERLGCGEIYLTGRGYGPGSGRPLNDGALGSMKPLKLEGEPLRFTQVVIKTDPVSELGRDSLELIFLHEVAGHAQDPFINPQIAARLRPEELIEVLTRRQSALTDPVWGTRDGSVQELTERFRGPSNLVELMSSDPGPNSVSPEVFLGLVVPYPNSTLILPQSPPSRDGSQKSITFFDQAVGRTLDSNSSFGPLITPEDTGESYPDLQTFAYNHRGTWKQQAESGNVRARFAEFALGELIDPLSDLAGKGEPRSIAEWANFVQTIGIHLAMYQVMVTNQGRELRGFFNSGQRSLAEEAILRSRELYWAEFYAQSIAFGTFLEPYMSEQTPALEVPKMLGRFLN